MTNDEYTKKSQIINDIKMPHIWRSVNFNSIIDNVNINKGYNKPAIIKVRK